MTLILTSHLIYAQMHCQYQFEEPRCDPLLVWTLTFIDGQTDSLMDDIMITISLRPGMAMGEKPQFGYCVTDPPGLAHNITN